MVLVDSNKNALGLAFSSEQAKCTHADGFLTQTSVPFAQPQLPPQPQHEFGDMLQEPRNLFSALNAQFRARKQQQQQYQLLCQQQQQQQLQQERQHLQNQQYHQQQQQVQQQQEQQWEAATHRDRNYELAFRTRDQLDQTLRPLAAHHPRTMAPRAPEQEPDSETTAITVTTGPEEEEEDDDEGEDAEEQEVEPDDDEHEHDEYEGLPEVARPTMHSSSSHPKSFERKRTRSFRDKPVFARISFNSQSFASSSVIKLSKTTTCLDVRRSLANKMKIHARDFGFYVLVMVFPSKRSDSGRTLSARTLRDEETLYPLVERWGSRSRSSITSSEDSLDLSRIKPKHRSRGSLRFLLKDIRGAPLDVEELNRKHQEEVNPEKPQPVSRAAALLLPTGIRSGYLQKASVKDSNVWRRRWFVLQDNQLLYCKSPSYPDEITSISLLQSGLSKARRDVKIPFCFELRTPQRTYELCAPSKEEYDAWARDLYYQIEIANENHHLVQAELHIAEQTMLENEYLFREQEANEPPLLVRVLSREETLKMLRDFVAKNVEMRRLIDTWVECELFRRKCCLSSHEERRLDAAGLDSLVSSTNAKMTSSMTTERWEKLKKIVHKIGNCASVFTPQERARIHKAFQDEQVNRRLSLALHIPAPGTSSSSLYSEIFEFAQLKILDAIEQGPFREFVCQAGYRKVVERVMGRI